jgi:hypothetical protein
MDPHPDVRWDDDVMAEDVAKVAVLMAALPGEFAARSLDAPAAAAARPRAAAT